MSIQMLPLSGSTNGRPILVATAGLTTVIHTAEAVNGVGDVLSIDRVWLYVQNPQSSTQTIIVAFGGTATADRLANGYSMSAAALPLLICDGLPLQAGLSITAASGSAVGSTAPTITGYVIRITL